MPSSKDKCLPCASWNEREISVARCWSPYIQKFFFFCQTDIVLQRANAQRGRERGRMSRKRGKKSLPHRRSLSPPPLSLSLFEPMSFLSFALSACGALVYHRNCFCWNAKWNESRLGQPTAIGVPSLGQPFGFFFWPIWMTQCEWERYNTDGQKDRERERGDRQIDRKGV